MSSVEAPTTPAVSNRERFRLELSPCQEWFTAYWASFLVLDIPATFCPRSLGALIWKTSNTVFTVTCLVYNWIDTDTPSFYLAYWSHLTLLLNALYTILSCCNTYFPVPQPGSDHRLGWRLKLTWAIFVLVSHASVVVTIFYWIAVWSPGEPVAFPNLTTHGVTMVTCLVDGLLVNRIPLKIHHWICLIVPYDLTYLIWSLIHAAAGIGNPNEDIEDLDEADEAIYTSLNWSKDPGTAAIYVVLVILVMGPIIFMTQWYLGTNGCCCCPKNRLRFLSTSSSSDVNKDHQDEDNPPSSTSVTTY